MTLRWLTVASSALFLWSDSLDVSVSLLGFFVAYPFGTHPKKL